MGRILRAILLVAAALAASACAGMVQEEDRSDSAVKARIEQKLRGLPDMDLRYVTVDVNAGIATISGIVYSREQQWTIDRLVRKTRGVEQILNNLVIQE